VLAETVVKVVADASSLVFGDIKDALLEASSGGVGGFGAAALAPQQCAHQAQHDPFDVERRDLRVLGGSCYADFAPGFSGPVRINGDYGSGDLLGTNPPAFLDKNAFQNPAAYTYGTTPRSLVYKLQGPSTSNQNLSLKRDFRLRESVVLAFQADANNVFNWTRFGNPSTNINSTAFGRITSQGNSPRAVQFNARITF